MAKRKTLPKDFRELLQQGDLEELKAVFDKCDWNARGGYSKSTALAFDECPHELASWLVENGTDIQAVDNWKNTPLHERSRSVFGNIQSLLELGADVNDASSSIGTPLHAAADSHHVENTKLLLAHGADCNLLNSYGFNPLEQALRSCNNIDIINTVQLAEIYLDQGIQITEKMKGFVSEIGKRFEFHRGGFNIDSVDEYSIALDKLYVLFGVEPVAKRIIHDGKAPITSSEKTWQKQHQDFWEQLVPSSGPCLTIQGEVIRITGRIANELEGNGGINWDTAYKKMTDAFLTFVQNGTPLPPSELTEVGEIVKAVKQRSGDTYRMSELGVKWVNLNPTPLKLPALDYDR
ncbi:ankyrin repeat domain-containing protein [Fluviicola sp.]|uniref:ankyrin repeat domain-containing protein n=1 Tax=Fluviicola sp. TaxID=1917219 RepID=UPI0031DA004E